MASRAARGVGGDKLKRVAEEPLHPQHMKENEEHDNDRANPLEEIEIVLRVGIFLDIQLAAKGDPDSINRVIEDGQEDENPFDGPEKGNRVNLVHLELIDVGSPRAA